MTSVDVHSSSEELNNIPLLRKSTTKRECKFDSPQPKAIDIYAKRKLITAIVLSCIFFLAEIAGGIIANSLAILTDSAHMFSDLSSFLISLTAIYLSARPSSNYMNFGWYRTEILGALFSVLLIWVVTGILIYSAVLRILYPNYIINANIMLTMAVIGVVINVIMAFILHPHSHSHDHSHEHYSGINGSREHLLSPNHSSDNLDISNFKIFKETENINLRAAFIHVLGDIIQSIGVVVAAIIIYFKPQWKIADPICTFLFSFLILFTTVFIFRDILCVLLERVPRNVNYNQIKKSLSAIPGVVQIHNLCLWSITLSRTALVCHLMIDSSHDLQQVLENANHICAVGFEISEVTIQTEYIPKNII